VKLVSEALSRECKAVQGAKVLVLGVAFKSDVDDARNSPAERVIELLQKAGALVRYHDPYVPVFRVGGDVFCEESCELHSIPLTKQQLAKSDVVVIVTAHKQGVDYKFVVEHAPLLVDSANATHGLDPDHRIVRVGAPAEFTKTVSRHNDTRKSKR
jgi:UDP-N-acetyl-D-mannosaminuronate dehydrogenase